MRVLASTTAGTGHFEPLLPILRACEQAGHEVLVACPDSFAAAIAAAQLGCAPFDDAPAEQMGAVFGGLSGLSYDEGNRIVIGEVFASLDANAALPRLSDTVDRWRPDVVVRDPAEFGSWVVAESKGVPHVRVSNGLLSAETKWAPIAAQGLSRAASAHGIQLDGEGRRLIAGPVIVAAPAEFDPPDGLDPRSVHRYASTKPAASSLPEVVPRGDEPLVYVTFGTVAAGVGLFPALHRRVLDALADAPVRVLVTTGRGVDLDLLSPLPPRAAVMEFLPQDAVLAHASAMVTHGGFGTVLGGLRAGVPMVVTPMFADQADNAARLAAVGAGIRVQPSEIPMNIDPRLGELVHEAVLGLLADDSVGAAARRLQRGMADQEPLADVVAATLTGGLTTPPAEVLHAGVPEDSRAIQPRGPSC